eukprot:scaffold173554_cov35-Tisochrysis_lutea.AAC.2
MAPSKALCATSQPPRHRRRRIARSARASPHHSLELPPRKSDFSGFDSPAPDLTFTSSNLRFGAAFTASGSTVGACFSAPTAKFRSRLTPPLLDLDWGGFARPAATGAAVAAEGSCFGI